MSGGLLEIAQCGLKNPERDCRQVMVKQHGLALQVERTLLRSMQHIPMLRIRHWLEFFLRNNCFHILVGLRQPHDVRECAILSAFWRHFRELHPSHKIFSQDHINLERAVPLLVHGDEGRGRRHVAHFVLSFHGMLGRGFAKQSKKRSWIQMECNFEGHTYTNRFLITTLRKKDYSDTEGEVWSALMEEVALDAGSLWEHGVSVGDGPKYFGIVLGLTGDWPFLHKAGGFTRSFNNIQKRTTVRNPPVGICHLCNAGKPNCDFEQLSTRRPDWVTTMFVDNPFWEVNPWVERLLQEPERGADLFSFDWFHTTHLGVLRNYLGSVLALLSEEQPEGNIEERFKSLTTHYKAWCVRAKRRAFVAKLSKEAIQWETTGKFPSGSWHKGALSTTLMEYVEFRFETSSFPHQPLLQLAAEACEALQILSRTLYRSSLWMEPEKCRLCAELGFKFLRRYAQMADLAKRHNRCLFVLQPKIHVFHHFMVALWDAHKRNVAGLNPLAKSCQPSEDFIGRPSRLSRRVTAQSPILHRVMDRYLQSSYAFFLRARFLIRPG